jgi:cytoskeleton protein RodZ
MSHQQELIPIVPGAFLKRKRLAGKISLAAAATAIGLDEKLLRAIESDQADHVAEVYRKGYILAYARHLDIPEDDIRAMIATASADEPELRTIFPAVSKHNPVDQWLRATSYVLASLLIGTLGWQFTHEAVRLSQSGSPLKDRNETAEIVTNSLEREPRSNTPVNASITSLGLRDEAGQRNTTQAEQDVEESIALAEGERLLRVSVSADSWVEITDTDGRELEMDLLRGGSEKMYQGKPPFRIRLGRSSAVKLYMDGEAVDLTPFTQDDVTQMTWPQQLEADAGEPSSN